MADSTASNPTVFPRGAYRDPDEINLLEYAYVLVKAKWVIAAITLLGVVGGYVVAKVKGPSYVASAVVAPREADSQKGPNLSGLGMFGGVVASQLSLGGNASLEKLDVVLDSRKFNAEMLEAEGLLPELYRVSWSDFYQENWDSVSGRWRVDSLVMSYGQAAGYVKEELLEKTIEKNNTMSISVTLPDSLFAWRLLDAFLRHLDSYIRLTVQQEARENRDFLETQLSGVSDPLLRQKIQELIASEVEKMMVVSKEAFRTIDPAYVSKSFKEKKLYPLVSGFGLFFLSTLVVVFAHALTSGDKSEEDRELIAKIASEVMKRPFGR